MNGLNRKMLRQPTCSVRMPPSVGPIARPTAAMPVQMPIAFAFALGSGNAAPDQRERRDVDDRRADALEAARHDEHADARARARIRSTRRRR